MGAQLGKISIGSNKRNRIGGLDSSLNIGVGLLLEISELQSPTRVTDFFNVMLGIGEDAYEPYDPYAPGDGA